MSLEPLKSEHLHRRVQKSLKEYIVTSGLTSGDMVPTEMELSERLGISRTAIREGLKGLEALGIIEVRPGIGRFLCEFNFEAILDNLSYSLRLSPRGFRDLLEVRIALESTFLVRDIGRFAEDDFQRLREIVAQMEKLVSENADESELVQVHTAFHLALYNRSDNSLLIELIHIFATVQRHLAATRKYYTEDRSVFPRDHLRIVEALEQRNAESVQRRLLEHFEEPLRWSRENLKGKG